MNCRPLAPTLVSCMLTLMASSCTSAKHWTGPIPQEACGICETHHCTLERELVPVIYGLPLLDFEYEFAREKLFPHAGPLRGGDVQLPETHAWACRCAPCDEARRNWMFKTWARRNLLRKHVFTERGTNAVGTAYEHRYWNGRPFEFTAYSADGKPQDRVVFTKNGRPYKCVTWDPQGVSHTTLLP